VKLLPYRKNVEELELEIEGIMNNLFEAISERLTDQQKNLLRKLQLILTSNQFKKS
jgi:predicted nucleic acid-binding protein